jgi:hypothetical protein
MIGKNHARPKHTQEKAGTVRASKADAVFHQIVRIHGLRVHHHDFLVFEPREFWRPLNQSALAVAERRVEISQLRSGWKIVPAGHLKIARRFNAGTLSRMIESRRDG